MRKRLGIYIVLLILIFIPAIQVLADSIYNISIEIGDNKRVTISGAIKEGAGHVVTVKVTDPNNKLEYLNSIISGRKGSFEFSFDMNAGIAGRYEVTINSDTNTKPMKAHYYFGVNADMKSLLVSNGSLYPEFSPNLQEFSVIVDSRVTSIAFLPMVMEKTSMVKVNDTLVSSGNWSENIQLEDGLNIISVVVTAYNGVQKNYNIKVIKRTALTTTMTAKASIDHVSKMVSVEGVINSGAGQKIIVKIIDPKGNIEYINNITSTTEGSFQLSYLLKNSEKGRYVVELSATGLTTPMKTYFDYGTVAGLISLRAGKNALSPEFDTNVTSYYMKVGNKVKYLTVTPTAIDKTANIKVNDMEVLSGMTSSQIELKNGINTIQIIVTAQDLKTQKNYTITIYKDSSFVDMVTADASISKNKQVTVSGFAGVGNRVSILILDPWGNLEYLDGTKATNEGDYQFSYRLSNTAKGRYHVFIGTADISKPVSTYFIYDPSNADLSGLSVSNGILVPTFEASTLNYNVDVQSSIETIRVIPIAYAPYATIKVNDEIVNSGSTSNAVPLKIGENSIEILVTSEDKTTTKEYIILVNRTTEKPPTEEKPPEWSTDATLSNLEIIDGVLIDPDFFSSDTLFYTGMVGPNSNSVRIKPTASVSGSRITVNGESVKSGEVSSEIALTEGQDTGIVIQVTAEDEKTVMTYHLDVRIAGE